MVGKFLKRGAIVDLIKSEERTNALRKRYGLSMHPIRATVCGCPDPNCGGWHNIITERTIPTAEECRSILKEAKQKKKQA